MILNIVIEAATPDEAVTLLRDEVARIETVLATVVPQSLQWRTEVQAGVSVAVTLNG